MSKKSFLERNEKKLSFTLLIAVILVWVAVFAIEFLPQQLASPEPLPGTLVPPSTSVALEGCHIEYGFSKCVDGNLVTSFFNPGTDDITRTSMYFYDGEDVDIYSCREPLKPGDTETLTTIPCTRDMDTSKVKLERCCGADCYETLMTEPSTDLYLVLTV